MGEIKDQITSRAKKVLWARPSVAKTAHMSLQKVKNNLSTKTKATATKATAVKMTKSPKKVFAAKAVTLPSWGKELRSVYRPKRKGTLAR